MVEKLWKVVSSFEIETIYVQSKSCPIWNVLVAAARHNFYFDGERSLFPACFSGFTSAWRLNRGCFQSLSSMQTMGDRSNLLKTKEITMVLLKHYLCDIHFMWRQPVTSSNHLPIGQRTHFPLAVKGCQGLISTPMWLGDNKHVFRLWDMGEDGNNWWIWTQDLWGNSANHHTTMPPLISQAEIYLAFN